MSGVGVSFISRIASETPLDPDQVIGYSDQEIAMIERLYDVRINGNFRAFLSEMGRSDGGLIGDDPIILYRQAMTVRGFILMQSGILEEIYNLGFQDFAKFKPFVFAIESETQYFFLLTASADKFEKVYQYDENSGTVSDTGLEFFDYMKRTVKTWGGREVVCRGELLIV